MELRLNNRPLDRQEHSVNELLDLEIHWPHENDKSYTLVFWDHDAPKSPYIHWMITDIHGDNYRDPNDRVLFSYTPPNPPSGTHRYSFEVFSGSMNKIQSERSGYPLSGSRIYSADILAYKKNGSVYWSQG